MPQFLLTDSGRMQRSNTFKYLGKSIPENGLENSTIEEMIYKIKRVCRITKNI